MDTLNLTGLENPSAKVLNQLLSEIMILYIKSLNYHWNVTGPVFQELHEMFGEFYEELGEMADKIAERVLAIKGEPLSTMQEFLSTACLKEGNKNGSWDQMVGDLRDDCFYISDLIKKIFTACTDLGDDGSADLVLEVQALIDKKSWMFSAFLRN